MTFEVQCQFESADVHRVAHQVRDVAPEHRRVVMQPVTGQDPAGVRPPRALARRVRIALVIRVLMVDAMRRHPEDRTALERQRAAPGQDVFDPLARLVAAMGQQAVIRHADAEHAGDDIQDEGREDRPVVDEEERGDRTDVERGHRDRRDPVQPLLIPAAVAQGRRCRRSR